MKNSSMLLTAVEQGDWSDSTISAAIDALKEDFGHDMRRCVLIVARFIQDATDAAILRTAKNHAESEGKLTPLVRKLLNEAVGFPADAQPRVKMVSGDKGPVLQLPRLVAGRKLVSENCIEVGAGWVLDRLAIPSPAA